MSESETKPILKKDEEKKESVPEATYLNFYFFKLNINIVYSYTYLLISVLMNLINRTLYQKYNFKFNFTLLLIQQSTAVFFFTFVFTKNQNYNKIVGKVSFQEFNSKKFQFIFVAFLFLSNLLCSFMGNQRVNTVMFLCLRKFLLIMNYLYDLIINKKTLPSYFIQSGILIVVGSIINGYGDLSFELVGYSIVFVNNLLTTLYSQKSESFSKENNIHILKLLVYISYISVPVLTIIIFVTGEFEKLLTFNNYCPGFFLTLSISCLFSIALNSSYFISVEKNSSLFTQILGNSKDIFISLLAYFTLGDFKMNIPTVVGFLLSCSGAFLFSARSFLANLKKNN